MALLSTVLLLAAPALAHAEEAPTFDPRAAQAHKQAALDEFAAKRYERAAAEFRAAYAIDPQPDFLFGSAQAERLRGNCAGAAPAYRAFLNTAPPAEHERIARFHLEQCERILAAIRTEQAPLQPPSGLPAAPAREAASWYKDPLGGVLTGAGALAIGLGIGFWVSSGGDADAARRAGGRDEFVQLMDDAESKRTIGIAGVIGGTALVGAGILRYMLRRPASESPISIAPGSHGASVTLLHRF